MAAAVAGVDDPSVAVVAGVAAGPEVAGPEAAAPYGYTSAN